MSEQQAVRTHGNHAKCPRFWVLRPAPFTLYNRLQASRAKESDVRPLLQRDAALMRHELGEKVYEERARGQKSCWTRILKSSPAVAEPSGTRCVEESIQASRHLGVFGRCVIQAERRLLKSDQVCHRVHFYTLWPKELWAGQMRSWQLASDKFTKARFDIPGHAANSTTGGDPLT